MKIEVVDFLAHSQNIWNSLLFESVFRIQRDSQFNQEGVHDLCNDCDVKRGGLENRYRSRSTAHSTDACM